MKINKNKKGFTLTELIIVIVIIGILAAVLIPSLSSYIKKAKISKGEQEAREMNTILAAEAIYQDREYFDAYEISKLLEEANFELKSKLPDYRFWYDASVNQIKYLSMSDAFEGTSAAEKTFTQDCIEALSSAHPQYRYVDTYDDELNNIIDTVRNLVEKGLDGRNSLNIVKNSAEKNIVINNMDSILNESIEKINNLKIKGLKKTESEVVRNSVINYARTFNTYDTVYVDDNLMYNRVYFAASSDELADLNSHESVNYTAGALSLTLSHMVFSPDTTKVPESFSEIDRVAIDVIITTPITIPDSVTTITNNAFTNISFCPSIIIKDTIVADNKVFSEAALSAIKERSSNVSFVTLYLNTDFTIEYKEAEAKLNDGKTVSVKVVDINGNKIPLETTVIDSGNNDAVISKYLIPNITFNANKVDFSKIEKCIIRRSILDNVCTYTAILIDKDLNCYKVESFGYVTDIDWNIEQDFIRTDKGQTKYGSTSATITVYLPAYVYNFTNYNGASMKVVVKPQVIKSSEIDALTGKVKVYNGIDLIGKPITFYIKDGVYDASTKKYVYTHTIDDLTTLTLVNADESGITDNDTCNQISIGEISIYTGIVEEDSNGIGNESNATFLFIRYYK